mmetsp:Transcript_2644/g.6826  ORF Transcript_2644/g.6826 Transcript_2644/m.6826 type:complete len:132 (+) Transcript_2644:1457-1852(+)
MEAMELGAVAPAMFRGDASVDWDATEVAERVDSMGPSWLGCQVFAEDIRVKVRRTDPKRLVNGPLSMDVSLLSVLGPSARSSATDARHASLFGTGAVAVPDFTTSVAATGNPAGIVLGLVIEAGTRLSMPG